ncbi:helix-turn-helix domain-containing protein [Luteolibacter soli]|uniref:helix-turn-helix domain-containing protein n=1 Tax=Luteolibacter soli TaxID=3135280 RepID=UPI0035C8DAC8
MPPAHATNHDELLSVAETAARWKSHPETVKRRIRSGALPALRFGRGMIRIRLSDLLAFEEAQFIRAEQ